MNRYELIAEQLSLINHETVGEAGAEGFAGRLAEHGLYLVSAEDLREVMAACVPAADLDASVELVVEKVKP